MKQRSIYVTEFDLKRLKELLDAETAFGTRNRPDLIGLQNELARAHVVSPKAVPSDVVTMNSRVTLVDLGTNEEITYELVFPADADASQDRISVFAPIGTAMLGYRVGDTFEWRVPDGLRKFKVKAVIYQPEASGDYHL
jgi:regulator of nucleoside diphosphate kinase